MNIFCTYAYMYIYARETLRGEKEKEREGKASEEKKSGRTRPGQARENAVDVGTARASNLPPLARASVCVCACVCAFVCVRLCVFVCVCMSSHEASVAL